MDYAKRIGSAALALALLTASAPVTAAAPAPAAFPVKVMVFTLFAPETQPWLANEPITRTFAVKGAFAPVSCTDAGLCVTTTGMATP